MVPLIVMAKGVVEHARIRGGRCCISFKPGELILGTTSPDSSGRRWSKTELVYLGRSLSARRSTGEGRGGFELENPPFVRVVVTDGMLRERLGVGRVVG